MPFCSGFCINIYASHSQSVFAFDKSETMFFSAKWLGKWQFCEICSITKSTIDKRKFRHCFALFLSHNLLLYHAHIQLILALFPYSQLLQFQTSQSKPFSISAPLIINPFLFQIQIDIRLISVFVSPFRFFLRFPAFIYAKNRQQLLFAPLVALYLPFLGFLFFHWNILSHTKCP